MGFVSISVSSCLLPERVARAIYEKSESDGLGEWCGVVLYTRRVRLVDATCSDLANAFVRSARETRCGLSPPPNRDPNPICGHVSAFSRSAGLCASVSLNKVVLDNAMVHQVLLRGQLASRASNGHVAFIPQCRKLVFEYCDKWPSSANARTFLHNHLEDYARAHPHVEIVVRERNHKQPIVRGFYCAHTSFISLSYSIPNICSQ